MFPRSNLVWNNKFNSPYTCVSGAVQFLRDFHLYRSNPSSSKRKMHTELMRWKKPKVGNLKLNIDAAIDRSNGLIGFGMILRDFKGDVVHCQTHKLSGKMEARLAEGLCLKEALS